MYTQNHSYDTPCRLILPLLSRSVSALHAHLKVLKEPAEEQLCGRLDLRVDANARAELHRQARDKV